MTAYGPVVERLRARGIVELRAMCGREKQRAAVMETMRPERYGVEAREVIEARDVDVVLILTSMPEHAGLARAALRAGKHVLVEKPMATTLAEGRELVELAERSSGHLVCAPFTTLSPTFRTLAGRIRRGDIGTPCSARARYGWSGPDWNEWFYKRGGGCLFDLAVYNITTLTGLLGPVQRVMAMTGVAVSEREMLGRRVRVEAEDNAQVLLDFGRSTFAVVTSGFTMQQYRCPAVEIYGTEGTVQMLGDDWDPDGYELWQNTAGAWQVFKETAPDWSWTEGLSHLIACLRTGRKPGVTPEHALHVLEILIRAGESGRDGRALPLETRFEALEIEEPQAMGSAHRVHDRSREH